MPSVLVSPLSGGMILYSGNLWSGQGAFHPVGSIQLRLSPDASGNAYVGFSGNLTVNSGGIFGSGAGGRMDGMIMTPGDSYNIPKLAFISGQCNIYMSCDAACSGQARMYWEAF